MKKFLILMFTAVFLSSCSGDGSDDEVMDPTGPMDEIVAPENTIIVNSIESSKEFAFVEDTISLVVDATGFTDLEVTTNNSSVTITKVNETTYSVASTEAAEVVVELAFSQDIFIEKETVALSFFEHGVINNNIIEGIEIDVDTSDKLIDVLGEPSLKQSNIDETQMRWHYFDLGLRFEVINETNAITEVRIYGAEFDRTVGDVVNTSGIYPYEIGNSLKISDLQLVTNTVFDTFGSAYETGVQNADDNLFFINYPDIDTVFFFFSSDIDNVDNKVIPYMNLY